MLDKSKEEIEMVGIGATLHAVRRDHVLLYLWFSALVLFHSYNVAHINPSSLRNSFTSSVSYWLIGLKYPTVRPPDNACVFRTFVGADCDYTGSELWVVVYKSLIHHMQGANESDKQERKLFSHQLLAKSMRGYQVRAPQAM